MRRGRPVHGARCLAFTICELLSFSFRIPVGRKELADRSQLSRVETRSEVDLRPCFWPVQARVRQHAKRFVLAPAVDCEILIQRQNVRGPKLVRQANQAGIRKINPPVLIFPQHLFDTSSIARELKRNLENPGGNVLDHRLRRARQVPQQIATLCNDGLASDERRLHFSNRSSARLVITLAAIQQRNNETCVEQDRLHRPNFRRCFLFDPRSRTPDSNLPKPMIPAFLRLK